MSKKPKVLLSVLISMWTVLLIVIIWKFDFIVECVKNPFYNGSLLSGRYILYTNAWKFFTETPPNILLGSGFVTEIDGFNKVVGYHLTIFEILVVGGIFCFISLIILWQKYKLNKGINKYLKAFILVGFISVDLYGIIDNIYFMYYYMVFLAIMLAVFDNVRRCD